MRFLLLSCLAFFAINHARAQYAPQAGINGSTAIHKSSSQFKAWATGCHIRRGLQQINDASYGYASLGDSSAAIGTPDGNVVSLGDSGVAVLTFASPIYNGPGFDFAVFENGFPNTANPEEAYLELAFVEVSSDGINFTRFPATSLTQDTAQLSSIAAPSYTNARHLNNLAGKYTAGYGTPFDLEELAGTPGLDINHITHIRLVDAIGSIGSVGSIDAQGRKVNDPFPTPFPNSGFDLDAVGVLHVNATRVIPGADFTEIYLYPNPAEDELVVKCPSAFFPEKITLFDAMGRMIRQEAVTSETTRISLQELQPGSYFISLQTKDGATCKRALIHH